jgi:ubiquitin carboxyl-terminal hydrolase 7
VKVNDKLEFPLVIDLGMYTGASDEYELFGVLSHSGSVNFGHYVAFLRTSTRPQWLEFNDTRVRKVSETQATQSNFSSAYVLVYVRRSAAEELFQPIADDDIPEHVRDPEANAAGGTVSVYDLDDVIASNTLSRKLGFRNPEKERKMAISQDATFETVYEKVAGLFGLPIDELRIWYGAVPGTVLPRNNQKPQNSLSWYPMFVGRKAADEELVPGRVVYLKFFYREWPAALQYLGSFTTARDSPRAAISAEVARRVGLPLDTPFVVYEENLDRSVRLLPDGPITTGQPLIFQCARMLCRPCLPAAASYSNNITSARRLRGLWRSSRGLRERAR